MLLSHLRFLFFFFFNDTATTEIYPLPLHDALPILARLPAEVRRGTAKDLCLSLPVQHVVARVGVLGLVLGAQDRKSTRLNSSHQIISYAVFCLKKKKKTLQ